MASLSPAPVMPPTCPACSAAPRLVSVYDDSGRAHNVYACDACGAVGIQRVWAAAGWTWVMADGSVMTPPRPTNPLTAEDAAAALVDAGLAASYAEARADLEAAREAVEAGRVVPSVTSLSPAPGRSPP